jgi:hypothetical protein
MKHKSLRIFLSAASIVVMSLACSLFTRFTRTEATPSPTIFLRLCLPAEVDPIPAERTDRRNMSGVITSHL